MIPTSRYKANTYRWCVVRSLPNLQRQVIAQFYRRSDADGCIRTLRRLLPNVKHEIVFQSIISDQLETIRNLSPAENHLRVE
jgi:hypothetical protein